MEIQLNNHSDSRSRKVFIPTSEFRQDADRSKMDNQKIKKNRFIFSCLYYNNSSFFAIDEKKIITTERRNKKE